MLNIFGTLQELALIVSQLSSENDALRSENGALTDENVRLCTQNQMLKTQVSFMLESRLSYRIVTVHDMIGHHVELA